MNVRNADELAFANQVNRIIRLGGSTTDLQNLFPERLGYEKSSANAKALRVYNQLKPDDIRVAPGRTVAFLTLLKNKKRIPVVSDFIKLVFPVINKSTSHSDMTSLFLECYESWLDNFENPGDTKPNLNFQQAFSVFKFVSNGHFSGYPVQFKKCPKCGSHYPILPYNNDPKMGRLKQQTCPYC